jgi:GH24 family phage-related lysozyme (muramidase)
VPVYRLSYAGQARLLDVEKNIPYVYDDGKSITNNIVYDYKNVVGNPTFGLGIKIDTDEERALFAPYLGGKKAPDSFVAQQNMRVIREFEDVLNRKLNNRADLVYLNPNQFDALFSLAWNRGAYSDIVKQVIELAAKGKYQEAAAAIADGPRTANGVYNANLAQRRADEAALFAKPWTTGTEQPPAGTSGTPQTTSSENGFLAWIKDPFVIAGFTVSAAIIGLTVWRFRNYKRAMRKWNVPTPKAPLPKPLSSKPLPPPEILDFPRAARTNSSKKSKKKKR